MKKNKKYWKKQAKYFESQYWEAEYTIAIFEDQLNVLRNQGERQAIALEETKRELNYFRQRSIGKKSNTGEWANKFMKEYNIPVGVDEATKRVIEESATLPKPTNTTGTSGSGYFYNTTIDFTKPKNKNRWFWNK